MAPNTMDPEALAAARYRSLVEQMRDELEARHGWKSEVARKLGVTSAFVGYVERGDREGGAEAVAKAQQALGLDFRFFHDPSLGSAPSYREYIVRGFEAHWQTFRQRYQRIGELTEEQLTAIYGFAARNLVVKSWTDFERLAEMVLRDKVSLLFEAERDRDDEDDE